MLAGLLLYHLHVCMGGEAPSDQGVRQPDFH